MANFVSPFEKFGCQRWGVASEVKDFNARQQLLFDGWDFKCMCNLCVAEGDSNNELYEKFEKLQQEAEVLGRDETNSWFYQLEKIKKEVSCYKEMYKLAKEKNASRGFILTTILKHGFTAATQGYLSSLDNVEGRVQNQEFKSDCEKFSTVGEQISTQLLGQEDPITIEWKKRRHDFEAWIRESRLFRNTFSLNWIMNSNKQNFGNNPITMSKYFNQNGVQQSNQVFL